MSWCSFKLPSEAWTILSPDGEMFLSPVSSKEQAERMAAQNLPAGGLKRAEKLGYRIVQIEIKERTNVGDC
jgi:hypothetical protein